jgi:hypothetical protein
MRKGIIAFGEDGVYNFERHTTVAGVGKGRHDKSRTYAEENKINSTCMHHNIAV